MLLYKRAFSLLLLRCTTSEKGKRILEDIHEGEFKVHIGAQSLAIKALTTEYYWSTLPPIFWSIRITENSAIGDTPFVLVYDFEVVLPMEVVFYSYRVTAFQEDFNNKALRKALELLPVARGDACRRQEIANIRITWFYNHKVKKRPPKGM